MLKINTIRIHIATQDGDYGCIYTFDTGLNIIRGNNTSGKSSLFHGILYCLRLEELFGVKNNGGMQSVYKEYLTDNNSATHTVVESFVMLEILNASGESITIKRFIKNDYKDSRLVEIYNGSAISGEIKGLTSDFYFVHDPGAATNKFNGFHAFLINFIGWTLPDIVDKEGKSQNIYMQQIAASFFIEQKVGWSDFLATVPHYSGVTGVKTKVIEFILDLDVTKRQQEKQNWLQRKLNIEKSWDSIYSKFKQLSIDLNGDLQGITSSPELIDNFDGVQIIMSHDGAGITLDQYIKNIRNIFQDLSIQEPTTIKDNSSKNEQILQEKIDFLNLKSMEFDELSNSLSLDETRYKNYQTQLIAVKEDLEKNKGAMKVKKLGAILESKSLEDNCPTCGGPIEDSLLSHDIIYHPMRLEDNIGYLDSQKKMLTVYIEGLDSVIKTKNRNKTHLYEVLNNLRQEIRFLKKELTNDERMPSVVDIEKKLRLEYKLKSYNSRLDQYLNLIEELKNVVQLYSNFINENAKFPNGFSVQDLKKLSSLETNFQTLLNKYGYKSESIENVGISQENYFPVIKVKKGDAENHIRITAYSSASDMIRCIWAFSVALLKTSEEFGGNHPGVLIFDEPKQQDANMDDFRSFIENLTELKESQIIVFASFENSESSFNTATSGVTARIDRISPKLIQKL